MRKAIMKFALNLAVISICVVGFSLPGVSAGVADNIVVNPGFEEALKVTEDPYDLQLTWTPKDSTWAKLTIVSNEKHSGNNSLQITNRAYWWASAYQMLYTFNAKETLTCSAWVKVAAGGGEKYFTFGIFDKTGNDMPTLMGAPISVLCNDTGWTQITGTFKPPVKLVDAYIGIYFQPADQPQISWDGIFYIDDVSITGSTGGTQNVGLNGVVPTSSSASSTASSASSSASNSTVISTSTSSGSVSASSKVSTGSTTQGSSIATSDGISSEIATSADSSSAQNISSEIASNDVTNAASSEDAESEPDGNDGGNNLLYIIIGVAVVLIAAGIITYILIKKRGPKT